MEQNISSEFKELNEYMNTHKSPLVEEVERKIEALNFIDTFKKEMGDIREWRPLGDCPYYNKIPTYHIVNCYLARLKDKHPKCSVINTAAFCRNKEY